MPDQPIQDQPPRVVIQPGGASGAMFPTVGVTLSQLVFWSNADTVAHFPVCPPQTITIPGKQGSTIVQQIDVPTAAFQLPRQVDPGQTSNNQIPGNALNNLTGFALPQGVQTSLQYGCSLHTGELGILELWNDFQPSTNGLQFSITRSGNAIPNGIYLI